MRNVVFVTPYFMRASLQFVAGAADTPGVRLYLVSVDKPEKLPKDLHQKLAGHWHIDDPFSVDALCAAFTALQERVGPIHRVLATLEQLQIPIAEARARMGIEGIAPDVARNFREKSRMKDVFRKAGLPCARHCLADSTQAVRTFVDQVGYPIVAKPPEGAGSKGTFRLRGAQDLEDFLGKYQPNPRGKILLEEFIMGDEYTFESAWVGGEMVWHSITRYFPNPLHVLENPWIQMCMVTPREIDHPYFDDIRATAASAVRALGLRDGFTHLEWFRRTDGSLAVSEVAVRPPGGQLTTMTGLAHRFNIHQAWAELMIFDRFQPRTRDFASGTVFLRGQGKGRVREVQGLDAVHKQLGAMIAEAKIPQAGQPQGSSYEGEGYIIIKHPETRVVESALDFIHANLRVVIA